MSDNPELKLKELEVGLVDSVHHLLDRQVKFLGKMFGKFKLCIFRKYPYPPQGTGRGSNVKNFKRNYEAKLEFLEEWEGSNQKKPSVGGVWIFSGTTQYGSCRFRTHQVHTHIDSTSDQVCLDD